MAVLTPTWSKNGVDLYLGDCREILPTLDAVDHVITDPPYEAEAHTLQRRCKRSDGAFEVMEVEPLSFAPIDEQGRIDAAAHMARLSDGWVLVFCQVEAAVKWAAALGDGGATYKRTCVWIKPDGMPQYSGDRPGMGYESIVTAWAGQGRSVWNGGGKHGVFTHSKSSGAGPNEHQTQKPLPLMLELVSLFSDRHETILDPFMGSGTTGVACVRLGRRFIGCEISDQYFEIAVRRIESAMNETALLDWAQAEQERLPI